MRRDRTVSQNKREHGVALFERLQNVAVTEVLHSPLEATSFPAILSPPFSISPHIQFSKNVAVSFEKSWHGNLLPFQSCDGCPRTLSSFSFTDTLLRFDYCWVKFFISIDNLNRVGEGVEPELETGVPFGY
ncbi:Hypothetical predicted protein [Prunus dulcis]|uniref:Uncharacterized protein n=1 Tax=Prunus dulcis TaxID=3755 RepID=A0A5E4GHT0_PRUDU|nr:Hypothetical predicted protein [Prunus dulcis]